MAIMALWGFDHLPQGTTAGTVGAGYGLAYSGYPITLTSVTYAVSINAQGQISGGWPNGGSGGNPNMNIPLSKVQNNAAVGGTRASWCGFRMTRNANSAGTALQIGLSIGGSGSILLYGNAAGFSTVRDYWIDMYFDRVNGAVVIYVDGVLLSTTAVTVANLQAANTALLLGVNNWFTYRDFYFLDDTQDATQCTRLGPIVNRLVTLSNVAVADWVASDSSDSTTWISTPFTTAASVTAPYVSSQPDQQAYSGKLNVTLGTGEVPLALQALVSGQRNQLDVRSGLAPTFTYNPGTGNVVKTSTRMTWTASQTLEYGKPSSVLETAPDGTIWTAAKIAATTLTLTPVDG